MRRPGFKRYVGEQLKRKRGLTDPEVQKISTEHERSSGDVGFKTDLIKKGVFSKTTGSRLERKYEEIRSQQSAAGLDLAPGTRLDKYLVEAELGRGGMGVVVKARHVSTGRQVAMKLLLAAKDATPAQKERFQKEIKLTARLRHPNIIRVISSGVLPDGTPYYTMDYVNGIGLDELIDQAKRVPPRLAMRIAHDVCEGLEYAHRRRVVHRDIKPENILIARGGNPTSREVGPVSLRIGKRYFERFHALIADFGIAREVGAGRGLTLTGAQLGTPVYMSPEQASGRSAQVDVRTDVYALGATLYAAVTGSPPFLGETEQEIYRKIIEQDPTPPRTLNAAVPEQVDAVILHPELRRQGSHFHCRTHTRNESRLWEAGGLQCRQRSLGSSSAGNQELARGSRKSCDRPQGSESSGRSARHDRATS